MGNESTLYEEVKAFILREKMIAPGETVVAGVSGGPDSVCLLHLLALLRGEMEFGLRAAHLEHGLRGEASLADAAFVEDLCRTLNVPCRVRRRDVGALARAAGRSCEEQGRFERYALFEEELAAAGGGKIAVAHNRDDQAETLLLNLARGSGLKGLCGMRPVRGRIIRPLLETGRDRIEAWLSARGIPWRVDETNAGMDFARNRVRQVILPQLKELVNEKAPQHLAAAAGYLQEADDYLEEAADHFLKENAVMQESPKRAGVPAGLLAGEAPAAALYILRGLVHLAAGENGAQGLTGVHYALMKEACALPSGKGFDLPGGLRAAREGELLWLSRGDGPAQQEEAAPEPVRISLTGDGTYRFGGNLYEVRVGEPGRFGDFTAQKKYTKVISCDTIQNTVCLRLAGESDRIVIDREGHSVPLREHLKKAKVPLRERDTAVVLADGSRVLWVVGGRIGEDAKVLEDTARALCITRVPESQGE